MSKCHLYVCMVEQFFKKLLIIMSREEEVNKIADEFSKKKETVDKAIEKSSNKIEELTFLKVHLKERSDFFDFNQQMYQSINSRRLNELSDDEYNQFILNGRSAIDSGIVYDMYVEDADDSLRELKVYNTIMESTVMVSGTATSTCLYFHELYSDMFNDGNNIIETHKQKDRYRDNISYINNQLKVIDIEAYDDFIYFIKKMDAFDSSVSQYQDLIGLRSALFLKLFNKYPGTRREQIINFVFGDSTYDNKADAIISEARDLYTEMSSQDDSTESVKLGNVTALYNQDLSIRTINILAALLKLREELHS